MPRSRSAACGRVRNEVTTVIVWVLPRLSRRADRLGAKSSSSATATIRCLVASLTSGLPFRARDTVARLTPARWATSRIVAGLAIRPPDVTAFM